MNMFKVGALGALMVLGGSVYGMDKDKELAKSLVQHAQPIAEPVFPATPYQFLGAGVLPLMPATPVHTPTNSQVSTPQSTPELEKRLLSQASRFAQFKASLVDGCKKVKSTVHSCWQKLPRWGKDTAELSMLAAVDLGMSALPQGNLVALLASENVVQTATDLTARHKWYYKLPVDAVVFGGCELLKYAGMDPWTVTLSSIMYAIESIYSDYAICNGRKTTLGEDFRDLSPATKKMVEERLDQIKEQVDQQLAARAQTDSASVAAPKSTCGKLKEYASTLPRGVKDGIEMSGLLALDFLMYAYSTITKESYSPMLISYSVGQTCSNITERHSYVKRLLGCGLVAGGCEVLKLATGLDFWTVSLSAIMCAVQATLDDYAVITGRKTTFAELFRTWPIDIQEKVITCLVQIGKQARAIEEGRVAMPLQPVKKDIENMQTDLASIALFAENDGELSTCQRLSRGKKDALELALMGATCAGFDIAQCATRGCELADDDWFASALVAYAVGRSAAEVTDHYPYYARILGGFVAWNATGGIAWATGANISTCGIAPIMHMVSSSFMEYAKKTGRTNGAVESFKDLPKDFQKRLCKNLALDVLAPPPALASQHSENHK